MYSDTKKQYQQPVLRHGRRQFLLGTAALGTLAALGFDGNGLITSVRAAQTPGDASVAFMRASAFVTGRDALDVVSGQRFYAALAKRNPHFSDDVSALLAYIDTKKLATMDAFVAAMPVPGQSAVIPTAATPATPMAKAPASAASGTIVAQATKPADVQPQDPALKNLHATATTIVSAWYLGIVGDGADSELITYAGALMYAPTKGILAVPTYGPGPLAWGPKPMTTGNLAQVGVRAGSVGPQFAMDINALTGAQTRRFNKV